MEREEKHSEKILTKGKISLFKKHQVECQSFVLIVAP